ncbi:MAG: hypothetical protein O3A55_03770 [Bacteroidetes bacterium]|nr:hypothetical protein [Bacteroidota bacterium]
MSKILLLALCIGLFSSCKEDITEPEEHFEGEGLFLLNTKKDTVIYYFQGKVRAGDTLRSIINTTSENLDLYFLDADKKTLNPPYEEEDHSLDWVITDTSIVKFNFAAGKKYSINHTGKKVGSTTFELQLLHQGHPDFRTVLIPVQVK